MLQLSHPCMTSGRTIALTTWTFVGQVMSLLFHVLSRFVQLASFNFMAEVTICSDFGAQENKVCHCFHCSPICLPWSDATRWHDLSFLNVNFQASFFHSSLLPSSRGSLVPLHFLPLGWYHLHIWGCWYFSQQSWFQLVIHPAWHFVWCTLLCHCY